LSLNTLVHHRRIWTSYYPLSVATAAEPL